MWAQKFIEKAAEFQLKLDKNLLENSTDLSPEEKFKLEAEILMNNFKSAFLL